MQRENRSASETNVWPTDKKRRRWMLQEGGTGAKIFIGSASCRGPAGSNLSPRSLLDASDFAPVSRPLLSNIFIYIFGFGLRRRTKKGFISTQLKIATTRALWKKNRVIYMKVSPVKIPLNFRNH